MKWGIVALLLALWAGYGSGHDTKPVPRWLDWAIHAGYAVLIVVVIAWIT